MSRGGPTDGMIEIGWAGGTVRFHYVGIRDLDDVSKDAVSRAVEDFVSECQIMYVSYFGFLYGREAILRELQLVPGDEPLTFGGQRIDGTFAAGARVTRDRVVDAFAENGRFQMLYGRAFVVFVYHMWEDDARRRIASALRLNNKNSVDAELMGHWRLLRNWILHPDRKAEEEFFTKSDKFAEGLGLQPGMKPEVTSAMVAELANQLNSISITVNPHDESLPLKLARHR